MQKRHIYCCDEMCFILDWFHFIVFLVVTDKNSCSPRAFDLLFNVHGKHLRSCRDGQSESIYEYVHVYGTVEYKRNYNNCVT